MSIRRLRRPSLAFCRTLLSFQLRVKLESLESLEARVDVTFLQNQSFSIVMDVTLELIAPKDVAPAVCRGLLLAGNNMGYRWRMLSFAYPSLAEGFGMRLVFLTYSIL